MTGTVHTQYPVYSRLTFALMEDTGWYIPDYSKVTKTNFIANHICYHPFINLDHTQYHANSVYFLYVNILGSEYHLGPKYGL